jgi:hypothetical protein
MTTENSVNNKNSYIICEFLIYTVENRNFIQYIVQDACVKTLTSILYYVYSK